MKRHQGRSTSGSITEFGAALVILICFVLVPLVNVSFISARYMLCQGVLSELTSRLSHCEKPSDAYTTAKGESWKAIIAKFGAGVSGERISILAVAGDGSRTATFTQGQKWPKEWLPGGSYGPCVYSLVVTCDCSITPVYKGCVIPGLDKPITISLKSNSQWENLSRDPKSNSLAYFIEE